MLRCTVLLVGLVVGPITKHGKHDDVIQKRVSELTKISTRILEENIAQKLQDEDQVELTFDQNMWEQPDKLLHHMSNSEFTVLSQLVSGKRNFHDELEAEFTKARKKAETEQASMCERYKISPCSFDAIIEKKAYKRIDVEVNKEDTKAHDVLAKKCEQVDAQIHALLKEHKDKRAFVPLRPIKAGDECPDSVRKTTLCCNQAGLQARQARLTYLESYHNVKCKVGMEKAERQQDALRYCNKANYRAGRAYKSKIEEICTKLGMVSESGNRKSFRESCTTAHIQLRMDTLLAYLNSKNSGEENDLWSISNKDPQEKSNVIDAAAKSSSGDSSSKSEKKESDEDEDEDDEKESKDSAETKGKEEGGMSGGTIALIIIIPLLVLILAGVGVYYLKQGEAKPKPDEEETLPPGEVQAQT